MRLLLSSCMLCMLPPATLAQVQFKRWADAERAMLSVNGTTPLESGKGRPLVCHFANPRRAAAGSQTSESAIAPRKLFVGQVRVLVHPVDAGSRACSRTAAVAAADGGAAFLRLGRSILAPRYQRTDACLPTLPGPPSAHAPAAASRTSPAPTSHTHAPHWPFPQIPKTSTEADVLSVFAPFGEVESVNILKSKGVHAGCAFVQVRGLGVPCCLGCSGRMLPAAAGGWVPLPPSACRLGLLPTPLPSLSPPASSPPGPAARRPSRRCTTSQRCRGRSTRWWSSLRTPRRATPRGCWGPSGCVVSGGRRAVGRGLGPCVWACKLLTAG